jgi:hypothetical protein
MGLNIFNRWPTLPIIHEDEAQEGEKSVNFVARGMFVLSLGYSQNLHLVSFFSH